MTYLPFWRRFPGLHELFTPSHFRASGKIGDLLSTAKEAIPGVSWETRRWNLALIASLPQAAFARRLTHPQRGEMTFSTLVETMAGHDLNHLQQIETIAARSATA